MIRDRSDTVVLIGPINTGKSTIARLLADRWGVPRHSMDDLRWAYYEEIGYSRTVQEQIRSEGGFLAVARYWKPFEAHAVERLLSEGRTGVIDFGGGHSVYEDDALFSRVAEALAPYEHVVLLLPFPDLDRSVAFLRERSRAIGDWDGMSEGFDFHEHFVKHPSNHRLATHVIYSGDQTPEQTCDEICRTIGELRNP